MAVIKRFIILANSIKNSGRCLAGKEMLRKRGGWEPGYVAEMGEPASLYFIEPEVVDPVRVWTEDSQDESGAHFGRHCRRITVRYRRSFHEFTVTDPVLQAECYPTCRAAASRFFRIPFRWAGQFTFRLASRRHGLENSIRLRQGSFG
jgi:hypothetical protein